ncbi:NTP transferase domain-containing protein [Mucilaginibacter myungsuensis]|uniref:Probable molybdenum cofactor guanylyltransferase n=1 Tax=Mucilaginibacter myungsuensis TaxID=649104 RepID=A0A929PVW6_9SPHI|nr:NTP transferase domain-containing protein [Mucilaginibacter myungsuensis]MBE9661549.1 NTP transferase domain-containing protein [Mucilaginibacter myungsuensis]MDN3597692.1 NTP transferase domain-containing protein [Mucilaginibacter myungsuensis]
MTLKKHSKHTALIRPAYGNFGRKEWAFVGAPCGDIKRLAEGIIAELYKVAKVAYVDAVHADEPAPASARLAAGAYLEYTELEGQQQFNYNGELNAFQNRALFNSTDLILINGNHHRGQKQVVIIDSKKKASLQKRLDQLTDVRLFLLADGENDVFDFVKGAIADHADIPVLKLNDIGLITSFFKAEWQRSRPELYGLVLSGGKSTRMGEDKGSINWHGKEQRYHMADLLKNYTDKVFISCRPDQQQDIDPQYHTLTDTFTGLGPFGAILSAFREQPEKAWLVVACDLPLLDRTTLDFLTANRDTSAVATAFQSSYQNFPEPLITIWEPKSYAVLLSFLAQGYSCPRKVLINSDTRVLQAPNQQALTNVNTPEEREQIQAILKNKTTA